MMVRGLALLVLFTGASAFGAVAYRCQWDGVARAECCCPASALTLEFAETRGERCCCSIQAAATRQTFAAIEHDRSRCVDAREAVATFGALALCLVDPSTPLFLAGHKAETALPLGTPRFLRLRILLN
ncbi:MAG TPA: hypothetical protein VE549_10005 [Myxococcaceae bacterium]|nr:hypothetical protein [Myxococcaceae bacterium]